jgi:hypothetical protein
MSDLYQSRHRDRAAIEKTYLGALRHLDEQVQVAHLTGVANGWQAPTRDVYAAACVALERVESDFAAWQERAED